MSEHNANKTYRGLVTNLLKRLNECIGDLEDLDEKRSSILFCIANLLVQNCDDVESLGLLEIVRDLLINTEVEEKSNSRRPMTFYIL
jgi:hypothetical protein